MASPEEMAATMIRNLKEKTGKNLQQWMTLLSKQKLEKHGQMVAFLKKEHGITHGFANLIAAKYRDKGEATPVSLLATQYSGAKADLRPIYDALIEAVAAFGKDVEISPKKAYVALRRNKQFAIVQPSTKTRVDVGLNLGKLKASKRLEASGSFNAMVSHRVRLENIDDVDAELVGWLKSAYESA